ncbi:putative membrane protein [Frondihabitans australicus]|uniref:Putative membrane protein n=2 Tax=Frondihabitans australicus TaxID=386892 RepID=A0A495IED1_9MICO|nr:putative membrane protein [Frondihabitans australicus]
MKADARRTASRLRLVAMLVGGVVAGAAAFALGLQGTALVIGWIAACLIYLVWVWSVVYRFDGDDTRSHALAEDPAHSTMEVMLTLAALASLGIVGYTVVEAAKASGAHAVVLASLAVASVALSWFLIHTLYMLRYAVLYFAGEEGGIDFNQKEAPDYHDFAYLAFDLGMTYQVSDTTITSREIRRLVTRHCLLSYLFGTVILATLVNLVAGLGG